MIRAWFITFLLLTVPTAAGADLKTSIDAILDPQAEAGLLSGVVLVAQNDDRHVWVHHSWR